MCAQRDGAAIRIRARNGVLLATGGFEHNNEMRKRFLRDGGKDNYSAGSPDNTGDGITAGQAIGGAIDLMDDAWWMPAFKRPDGVMSVLVSERSIPRSIIVDQTRSALRQRGGALCHVRAPAAGRPATIRSGSSSTGKPRTATSSAG